MIMNDLAIIKPFACDDPETGDRIVISVSDFYTKLSVNDREHYFIRETGEADSGLCRTGSSGVTGPDPWLPAPRCKSPETGQPRQGPRYPYPVLRFVFSFILAVAFSAAKGPAMGKKLITYI